MNDPLEAAVYRKYPRAGGQISGQVPVYVDPATVDPPVDNILHEADRITSTKGDRPSDYGHPRDNLQQTADLWSPILGVKVTADQVALCMIQLKISRQCHKAGRDNLVDIAGWARTIERLSE